jgi:phosphoribosyl 1,2-cyclic phosphodiesterase
MIVHILASGSDGNAALVLSDDTALLFDAGLGPRQLKQRMKPLGLDLSDITACFLTHEHNDHLAGLRRLSFPNIPVFANLATRNAALAQNPDLRRYHWEEHETSTSCQVGAFTVQSFPTSHDAARSVGFMVRDEEECLALATDLGTCSEPLAEAIAEADYLVLESNHDEDMLHHGPYPYHLKRRVASRVGHLSNRQTAELLHDTLTAKTRWLALAHLSRTNNEPSIALSTIYSALERLNRIKGLNPNFKLKAAPSLASGQMLSLK